MAKADGIVSRDPYQVLALKYRPATFADLVGQEHIRDALVNALTTNRVAHAFLFAGSRGTGKTTTARILAKALNCLNFDAPTPTPCGSCLVCRDVAEGRDLDVLEIDGASNNGVDQIRELRTTVQNKPARDRYRVVIIDEVHMLSTAAFNALLKTLEEPPAHVKFIFATTDAHKLPDTILSRCQHYDFRRIRRSESIACLQAICDKEGIRPGPGVLETIAELSEGGLRDAQSRLDQVIAFRGTTLTMADVEQVLGMVGRARLREVIAHMREGATTAMFDAVDGFVADGKDLGGIVRGLMGVLREMLVLKASGGKAQGLDISTDERAALLAEAEQWTVEGLTLALDLLGETGRRMKYADLPRIILETALLRLCDLRDIAPIRDILRALQEMTQGEGTRVHAGTGKTDEAPRPMQASVAASQPQATQRPASLSAQIQTSAPSRADPSPYPAEKTSRGEAEPVSSLRAAAKNEGMVRARSLIEEVFGKEKGKGA